MAPRLPNAVAAASSHCKSFFVKSVAHRPPAASLSSSACLADPRQPPHASSSGAAFLNLDSKDSRRTTSPSSNSASTSSTPPSAPRSDTNAVLSRVLFDSETRRRMHENREQRVRNALERMAERKVTDDYMRQMPRRWRAGDVYAPHDLSPVEMDKWKRPQPARADVVDILGINPIDEYRNFAMISEYVSTMGRIRSSRETGLRPVNQRRMARAIRRAIGLGLHPSVHRHPEILASETASLPKLSSGGAGRRTGFRV